jgi:hypothetical protein
MIDDNQFHNSPEPPYCRRMTGGWERNYSPTHHRVKDQVSKMLNHMGSISQFFNEYCQDMADTGEHLNLEKMRK